MEGSQAALEPGGPEIVLHTNHLGSLKPNSPDAADSNSTGGEFLPTTETVAKRSSPHLANI
jgi:hypothetical protein